MSSSGELAVGSQGIENGDIPKSIIYLKGSDLKVTHVFKDLFLKEFLK